jgi:hypothetical protein
MMTLLRILFSPRLALALVLASVPLQAQEGADTTDRKDIDWFAFPYAFYTPETNLAVGAGGIVYFYLASDTLTKPSSVSTSFFYSVDNQFDFSVIPEVYFERGEFYLYGYFSIGQYLDKYYGNGPTSVEIPDPEYLYEGIVIKGNFQWSFTETMKFGPIAEYQDRLILDKKSNPYLLSDTVLGSNGGNEFGLGAIASWDTRNHRFYPSHGHLFEASALFVSRALGGDFDYNRYKLDMRWYHPLTDTEDHILGIQAFGSIVRGQPPFYDLSALGGKMIMRGYYTGRFRDFDYAAGQVEYRTRIIQRIGLVLFAGLGTVSSREYPIRAEDLKASYGIGFRYVFDLKEKIDIRADFGFGPGTSGVYFDIQQAF